LRTPARRASKLKKSHPKKNKVGSRKDRARSYSVATIKVLFALSRNLCAFPDCPNEIVAARSKQSTAAVVGHICHIYAASDSGPRGKPGLAEEERNSPDNLILMCGHHHPLVDKQWETYPASTLLRWKKAHEAKATSGAAQAIKREADIEKHGFLVAVSDAQIEKELVRIRRARDLFGFPAVEEAQRLAVQVEQSKYSSGSSETRARALAWCARILSQGKTIPRAKELLRKSRELAVTPDAALAQAFITAEADATAALTSLARIRTPRALSAALRIVTSKDGAKGALAWVSASGLTVGSFDAEGKFTLMRNYLAAGEWGAASEATAGITEGDLTEYPTLLYTVAMARLMLAIPSDFRAVALAQVPFEADDFPLASTPEALAQRRTAKSLFQRLDKFARDIGAAEAGNLASDYALWLALRDQETRDVAMIELRDSMSDPVKSLRRVNFAVKFGLKMDYEAIEKRIDRNVALSGEGSADEAAARFSLAFTKESPREAADYIAKHRAQLYKHLNKPTIRCFEIEILARAGLITTARERFREAVREGLDSRNRKLIEGILTEAAGADPIAARRALYERTGELRALDGLIDALEKAQLWRELLPYCENLFEASPSVEAYERLVRCLNELARYGDLLKLMSENQGFIDQSEYLTIIWAWTLYREGRFAEASAALARVSNENDANCRRLRVNIAVASGAWDELLNFCQDTWHNRDQYSAPELMDAARISTAVNGPHSRDLVTAATEKEPQNPNILAAAYFQATQAGWEQSPRVAGWLHRAAQLSGGDGPLKAVTMQEVLEKKPEWDKQAVMVWDLVKKGKIPNFAAGRALHRSMLEFYLLPSLANPAELDVRKRSIVFAYSGARALLLRMVRD
jgi:hypothetical protein